MYSFWSLMKYELGQVDTPCAVAEETEEKITTKAEIMINVARPIAVGSTAFMYRDKPRTLLSLWLDYLYLIMVCSVTFSSAVISLPICASANNVNSIRNINFVRKVVIQFCQFWQFYSFRRPTVNITCNVICCTY